MSKHCITWSDLFSCCYADSLFQQLLFLVHHGLIGTVYLHKQSKFLQLHSCFSLCSWYRTSLHSFLWYLILLVCRPAKNIDYMICFPAHGAIIGAWFGAWPMPLDWERPWQVLFPCPCTLIVSSMKLNLPCLLLVYLP